MLFKQSSIRPGQQKQETLTARGIAQAMQAMNCRAVGIAPRDLAGGIDLLKEIQDKQNLNWLSMNLVDPKTQQPIFTPSMHVVVDGTGITILGLTDNQADRGKDANYSILPWQEVLPEAIARTAGSTDMVILLSNYPEKINNEIAGTIDGIDLILQSGHSTSNKPPNKIKNTLLAQTGARGKYLGLMHVNWTENGQWGENISDRIRAEQNRLDRINWQIGRMEKRSRDKNLENDKRYKQLTMERDLANKKIAALQKAKEQATGEPCSFTNQFIGLKSSMPEDREIQAIIDQTTLEVNRLNRKRVHTSARQQNSVLSTLAGWQQCRQCHPKQVSFWQTTDHAGAWQTLKQDNQQFNEDCLLCHVTLPYYDADRVRAENLLLQLPASLNTVGCEACHGPAAAHSKDPEVAQTILPNEKTCLQCHTPDHDDNFVFSDKLGKIRCPRG